MSKDVFYRDWYTTRHILSFNNSTIPVVGTKKKTIINKGMNDTLKNKEGGGRERYRVKSNKIDLKNNDFAIRWVSFPIQAKGKT